MRRATVIMAKRPKAGSTKTRLTPALSPQQAADFAEHLFLDTLASLVRRPDCTPIVALDAPASASYFDQVAPGVSTVDQLGDTLGERLDAVLMACLDRGFDRVFAIGSDSPDLPQAHLDAAFEILDQPDVDVVLGPTNDGGYYLIGWKQRWERLVHDVTMSTPTVLADTLAIAQEIGARVELAPTWYDIDTPDDLHRFQATSDSEQAQRSLGFLASLGVLGKTE